MAGKIINMKRTMQHHPLDLSGDWAFAWREEAPDGDRTTREALEALGLTFRPCRVPGNFELDLLALGEIAEPYFGMNMLDIRRFESVHVWYATPFARPRGAEGRNILRLDGADCFASVHLNGKLLGQCDNMLIPHAFDVTNVLEDQNALLVHLRPPVQENETEYPSYLAAGPGQMESLYVRKAPHMYGWDIMPRALARGLWRGVSLETLPVERIDEAFLQTLSISPNRDTAQLRLNYRLCGSEGCTLRLRGVCGESTFESEQLVTAAEGSLDIEVTNPNIWWPRDAGEANLYDVELTLFRGSDVVDGLSLRHGIRTVRLEHGPAQFRLIVNGEPIFVRGTNWVPLDAFHSRDQARLPRALELLSDVGCNLVRCWGGNVYESDEFFDYCDAHGIMVWQDFAMACMVYPRESHFQTQLAKEARAVITRLREHPSLVLWAGDNECDITMAQGWHGPKSDPNSNVLTRQVLPEQVSRYDGTRPYLPSSPYLSPAFIAGEQPTIPEDHLWGPRGYYKAPYYAQATCAFVSEIGYHGCPSPDSIREFISEPHLWPYTNNPEWQLHATDAIPGVTPNAARNDLMASQVKMLFGTIPDSLERFAQASQICQAEAMKHFIDQFRSGKWRRTGIIWWNLLDGWPQFSDAVVDYYFRKKLAYHYIKQAQTPVSLILTEPDNGKQLLIGVNDYLQPVEVHYTVTDLDTEEIAAEGAAVLAQNAVTELATLDDSGGAQRFSVIAWQCRGESFSSHYLAGTPPYDLDQYLSWMKRAAICADTF